ncbi:MAG: NUDIX domain-containing protein [Verrucomicrobiae bacterium]|nr:NUDIX domain-containing protein [Verrucomicrobiae bacterium]
MGKKTPSKTEPAPRKGYRRNVAAVILNPQGQILIAARVDFPKSWQFPQGGVDKWEREDRAVLREVREELGLTSLRILRKSGGKFRYRFGKKTHFDTYIGQEQRFYLLAFSGNSSEIRLKQPGHKQEFCRWKWVAPTDFPYPLVFAPKQPIYRTVLAEFFPETAGAK